MMKVTVCCVLIALVTSSYSSPIENHNRFSLIPNAEGQMYMIDLEAPQDLADSVPFFTPANDIRFMLYTRNNPSVGQRILLGDLSSVLNSNYNAAHPTRFTVHGWMGSEQSTVNRNVAREYFLIGDFNVIKFTSWILMYLILNRLEHFFTFIDDNS
jgi:pancreatic triacylglycerol lipase